MNKTIFEPDFIKSCITYSIILDDNPANEKPQLIGEGIDQHFKSKFQDKSSEQLTFFLIDKKESIAGGVHGKYGSFGWLYISALWLSKHVRGNGFGSSLMNCIEQEAIKKACKNVYLDTFSFQAPEFYKKLGYTVFGQLEDFPIGHSRIFLKKNLVHSSNTGTY